MGVESDNDLLSFLSLDEFGVSAMITSNSSTRTVVGIFDNSHYQVDNGVSVVSTSEPKFLCRTCDVATVEQDDLLVLSGINWVIMDVMHDGTGMTTLRLHKQ